MVVAVVALMVGILLPALGAARVSGQGVVCLSNLRQIGTAQLMAVDEREGLLPSAGGGEDPGSGHAAWLTLIEATTGVPAGDYAECPADMSRWFDEPQPVTQRVRRSSFGLSFYLSGRLAGYERYQYLRMIQRPAMTVSHGELAEDGLYATTDHFHPENWLIRPDEPARELSLDRHLGSSHYLYLDGHASAAALSDLYELAPGSGPGNLNWIRNRFDPEVAQ